MLNENIENGAIGATPAIPPPTCRNNEEEKQSPAQELATPQHPASAHFRLLFEPTDRICLTFIDRATGEAQNYFISAALASTPICIERLQAKNDAGCEIYVSMNPIKPGGNDRTKESVGEMRNAFLDVDDAGDEALILLREKIGSGQIPRPTAIIQSSPHKFQVAWRINSAEFDTNKIEGLNRAIIREIGGDVACSDVLRVLRVPGFKNYKYQEQPVVNVIEVFEGQRNNPNDFKIQIDETKIPPARVEASNAELISKRDYFEIAAEEARLDISSLKQWGSTGFLWEITCPWVHEHSGGKDSGTVVILHKSGALDFRCLHQHCRERRWAALREELERSVGHTLPFADPVGTIVMNTEPATSSPGIGDEAWGELQPLENSLLPVQPFKIEFLPSSLQPWAKDVAERMSVPLDFVGICALAILAGATNRRAFVFPKQRDKEWKEALAISGAVIASSGRLKTPTWKTFTNILLEIESVWREEFSTKLEQHEREVANLEKGAISAKKPVCRRLMLNDSTPEMMHQVMTDNPAGLLIYRDEMASWVAELDKEGREVERGMYLAAMNGDDGYAIDRIGRGSVFATMSASLFGGFQPDLLVEFLSDARNISDGMIARFGLLVWPDNTVIPRIDREADIRAKQRFGGIIRALAEMKAETVALHFSPEAQACFNDWYDAHDRKVNQETHSGKQSHLSKYRGLLPKLAGLLQLADLVDAGPIVGNHLMDVEHLNRAIGLLRYLESHMNRVYASIRTPEQKAVESLAKHIAAGDLSKGFSLRDLRRKKWEYLSIDAIIMQGLECLADMNWVRTPIAKMKAGRPTLRWEVNPILIGKLAPK